METCFARWVMDTTIHVAYRTCPDIMIYPSTLDQTFLRKGNKLHSLIHVHNQIYGKVLAYALCPESILLTKPDFGKHRT